MTNNSVQINSKECLSCRLITGFGVIGIGVYLFIQAKQRRKVEMNVMKVLASGAFGLGTARLFDLDFLKADKKDS